MRAAMEMSLAGRVAIVTGGASGIGRAIARGIAEAGAAGIVIADIQGEKAGEVVRSFGSVDGLRAVAEEVDVTDERAVQVMVDRIMTSFGRLDVLVNNAGICPVTPWEEASVESWRRIIEVNLTGMYVCTRAVIPAMVRGGYGRILFISSMGGLVGSIHAHVAYGVSKAGVLALMKSVAKTFADRGVLANAICPGSIDTPMTDSFGADRRRTYAESCLLKRQGTDKELADAAVFLVSDRSTYITGTVLNVNGGVFTC